MSNNTIDARLLRQMFLAGAKNLELNKEWINDLNVFPVPDGDTGTNMTLTILSAVKEVQNLSEVTMETLSKAISSGSLRGARGNSGVILSQLFRGFTKELKTLELLDRPAAARALQRATETAYKAVMKPKEGTILTVARGISDKAAELAEEEGDMESFLEQLISHGEYVLSCTPDMLPVLKQAGVVDSGGQGLIQVLKGTYDGLLGKEIEVPQAAEQKPAAEEKDSAGAASADLSDIKFGYCTEFIINLEKEFPLEEEHSFKAYLESIGDSIVVVADDEIVKVHVHTNDPGLAIQKALTYGSLSRMKIDNMREEHEEKLIREASRVAAEEKVKEQAAAEAAKASEPRKEAGFVAVSIGDGLAEIFRGLNVDYIIEGGQTMNPSTESILEGVNKIPAETVFVLPNNGNIIMAAQQCAALTEKQVVVIPTKTVPQGITAMMNVDFDAPDAQSITDAMTGCLSSVTTAQITYAARDSDFDGFAIKEGDYLALEEGKLFDTDDSLDTLLHKLAEDAAGREASFISLYFGEDVQEADAQKAGALFEEVCPGAEVAVLSGGQPVYYYIISME